MLEEWNKETAAVVGGVKYSFGNELYLIIYRSFVQSTMRMKERALPMRAYLRDLRHVWKRGSTWHKGQLLRWPKVQASAREQQWILSLELLSSMFYYSNRNVTNRCSNSFNTWNKRSYWEWHYKSTTLYHLTAMLWYHIISQKPIIAEKDSVIFVT